MPTVILFVATTDGVEMSDYVDELYERIDPYGAERAAMLVVATEDREYQLYVGATWNDRISGHMLEAITSDYILPHLRLVDWCGAALGAFDGLDAAALPCGSGQMPALARACASQRIVRGTRGVVPDLLADFLLLIGHVDP